MLLLVDKCTSLAVASIETALGSGSGFFISEDGYIVTNKHVIRPTEFKEWKKSDKEFSDARAKIKDIEQELSERKARLKKMEQELSQYKRDIDRRYSDSERKVAYAEYDDYEARLNKMKSNYRDRKKWLGKKKRELSSRNSSFSTRSASAKFARKFKVTLKGGTQVKAKLIKLSDKHDLALIKLDGHITPSIDITLAGRVRQGMKVFAIGSPLGLKDFVTSGIITSKRSDSIYTDTQILPGNSGGPLVNEQGHVLGVNTQKLMSTASIGSEGFGIAIPIKWVAEAFSGYLKKPVPEKKWLPEEPS